MTELSTAIAAYIQHRQPENGAVTITDLRQIPGGASRETWRFRANWNQDGETISRGMIIRRDPVSSLIDTERALEYNTYAAVFAAGRGQIPVPEPLWLEEDPDLLQGGLERPFSIMAEIPGCHAQGDVLATPEFAPLLNKIAEQKWTILGHLTRLDLAALNLDQQMERPAAQHCAQRELDYWTGVIDEDAIGPEPVLRAAIRWLRRNLPPPAARVVLVHGDYRTGNYLFNDAGEIKGILDWEMAHFGDPLEDLAWSLDPLWSWPEQKLAGRLAPREQAIKLFEAASGIQVDRTAFRWWQVFASVKAAAIWVSSAREYLDGPNKEPIVGLAGAPILSRQTRILIDRLSPVAEHRWAEPLT